jgi:tRNA/tmRNA/rRNA uracil-C5-methylase (TrmA/RlmC/RlmD family)
MAEKLTELVVERCAGGNVLDLYGGVGTLGIPIAASGAAVVSVDLDSASSDAGREAARINGVDSIEFVHMRDRNFLSTALERGMEFETVVSDPPRAGMGIRISRMVTRLGARSIIYVSCNPFSLARDMACLMEGGYIAREILPLDMFPQTDHVEVLVLLEREG